MAHTFTVLHLSDLHERGPRESEPARRSIVLGEQWLRNLAELRDEYHDGIDLVCVTGDLAQSGRRDEYECVGSFLEDVLSQLRLSRERLFVIPGNHDIDRSRSQQAWQTLRRDIRRSTPLTVARWMAGGATPLGFDKAWRAGVLRRQEAFRSWLKSFGLAAQLPVTSPHGRLGYRVKLQLSGRPFDVHVIGLDSAWLAGGDDDAGNLLLTDEQIHKLCTNENGKQLTGFRLVLVHHPLSDLADGAKSQQLLADFADLLLRGHQHTPEPEQWINPDRILRQFAAGCLFEGSLADSHPSGYNLLKVTCNDEGRPQRYEIRFRSFSPRNGHWHDDSSLYRGAKNGRWTLELDPAPSTGHPALFQRSESPSRVDTVFVGRATELELLRSHLLTVKAAKHPTAVCAVQGMAGVGKSYLCDRFAALHASQFPGGYYRLALSPLTSPTGDSLLAELANTLDLRAPLSALSELVVQRLVSPRSLLHIENANTEPDAKAIATLIPKLAGCAIIVSGRYQGLGRSSDWGRVVLSPLTEVEGIAQLIKECRTPRDTAEEQEFRALVNRLGALPLAIHLCAGYLQDWPDVTLFLQNLQNNILSLHSVDPADTRAPLGASIDLSLTALQRQLELDSTAERFLPALIRMGDAPPRGVGTSLGAMLCGLKQGEFAGLMAAAHRLSLVEWRPSDGGRAIWCIHPLIAEFLRSLMDNARPGMDGMGRWFLERLPELPSEDARDQGSRWKDIHDERDALVAWLAFMPDTNIMQAVQAGMAYATSCGPFSAWAGLCERGLRGIRSDSERSYILWALCCILAEAGEFEEAQRRAEEKIALDRKSGSMREVALAHGKIADILQARGQLEEALRVRREETLPVYKAIGDIRSCAMTMGQVADVLQLRGHLDEALRIRREDELPVYAKLGDVRERAVTMGKIADILQARGQMAEALHIRQEDELKVYEQLGDLRLCAATMGKIADNLQAHGQLDEALRIHQEQVLPIFARLDEKMGRALTMSKIAEILQARGQIDEALRIHQEQVLPIFAKLDDPRLRAVTMGRIADIRQDRGETAEALRIRREEVLPVYRNLGDIRSRAVVMGKIAECLHTLGQGEECARILREEVLPVYEKLGATRERAITLRTLADIMADRGEIQQCIDIYEREVVPAYQRLGDRRLMANDAPSLSHHYFSRNQEGDRERAQTLLRSVQKDAEEMGLPVTKTIRNMLAELTKIADAESHPLPPATTSRKREVPLSTAPMSTTPTRAIVRNLLTQAIKSDTDFDAFCLDYFPSVHQRFTNGMEREQKRTLLLLEEDLTEIFSRLCERFPAKMQGPKSLPTAR